MTKMADPHEHTVRRLRELLPDWVVEVVRLGARDSVVATLLVGTGTPFTNKTNRARLQHVIRTMMAMGEPFVSRPLVISEYVIDFFSILSRWSAAEAESHQ